MNLHWHIKAGDADPDAGSVGMVYRLDRAYQARATWLRQTAAPRNSFLRVDIRADGESIFPHADAMPILLDEKEQYQEDVALPDLAEGAVVTLHIIQRGDGSGPVSVSLELDDA